MYKGSTSEQTNRRLRLIPKTGLGNHEETGSTALSQTSYKIAPLKQTLTNLMEKERNLFVTDSLHGA